MKVYTFKRSLHLPVNLQEAWEFFSSPRNLAKITPPDLNFRIVSSFGEKRMHTGQIIRYKLNPLPFITFRWVSEITSVKEPFYFVDEQVKGPYALWRHRHSFKETHEGIEATDEVEYAVPLGILGQLTNRLFVKRKLKAIFDFREKVLKEIFHRRIASPNTAH